MIMINDRFKIFIKHLLACCGIVYVLSIPDSFLTSGESFLTAIICLCFLELSTDIRILSNKEEKEMQDK